MKKVIYETELKPKKQPAKIYSIEIAIGEVNAMGCQIVAWDDKDALRRAINEVKHWNKTGSYKGKYKLFKVTRIK